LELLHIEKTEDRWYKGRTNAERVNACLKDEFGGRMIRVCGYAKVMAHLMFGIPLPSPPESVSYGLSEEGTTKLQSEFRTPLICGVFVTSRSV
jgi:hypothetical protein